MKWTRKRMVGTIGVAIGTVALLGQAVVAEGPGDLSSTTAESDAQPVSAELETDTIFGDYEFVSGRAFTGEDSADTYSYSGNGCVSTTDTIGTDLDLPQGADISTVTLFFNDADGTNDATLELWRYGTQAVQGGSSPGGGANAIYAINTGDGNDSGYQALIDSSASPDGDASVIDHGTYTYAMRFFSNSGAIDLCGVRISYTYEDSDALTFHQTEPCAAFDTREGQGGRNAPLSAQQAVTFDLIRNDYSSQGGTSNTSGCNLPNGTDYGLLGANPNGTVAVLVNLVALNPEDSGNLKIWDNDDGEPNGGVVVFSPDSGNNSNAIAIGVDDGNFISGNDGGQVVVKNNSGDTVDVRGVILGYYTTTPKNQE